MHNTNTTESQSKGIAVRILCWLMLGYIAGILLFPMSNVIAATVDSIRITATGSNTSMITDFVVVASDVQDTSFQADGSWNNPVGDFDYVIIRRSFTDYPSSPTDGHLVYQGTGESFSEIIETTEEQVYYSAWAVYEGDYSPVVHYLLEVESGMVNVMTLGIFVALAIIPTVACLVSGRGKEFLAIIAGFGWLILGIWTYTQSDATWDIYFSIAFFSLWMVLLFVLIGAGMYREYRKGQIVEEYEPSEDEKLWGEPVLRRRSSPIRSRAVRRFEATGEE